jgi:hypothetical protein
MKPTALKCDNKSKLKWRLSQYSVLALYESKTLGGERLLIMRSD